MSAGLILLSVALTGLVVAAWKVPPPERRFNGLASALALIAVVDCVAGTLRGQEGRPLLVIAIVASAVATWLLRAPADDDGGGEPPPEPDPDAPDPNAFDWDDFERSRQPALWSR